MTNWLQEIDALPVEKSATDTLTEIANSLGWPAADILDFYQTDLPDIQALTESEVSFLVIDYCKNYRACRDEWDQALLEKSREMRDEKQITRQSA